MRVRRRQKAHMISDRMFFTEMSIMKSAPTAIPKIFT